LIPAILTHGYGDRSSSWQAQVDALSSVLTARTWDLPGHGERFPLLEHGVDIDRPTMELASMVQECSEPPLLIGHSVGGYISLRCAAIPGISIRGLVLISTGPGFRSADRMREWNLLVDRLTEPMNLTPATASVVHMKDSQVMDSLPSIQVPTMVLLGSKDRPVYHVGSRLLTRMFPRATMLEIEGGAHDVHQTHAAAVNAAVRRFVLDLLHADSFSARTLAGDHGGHDRTWSTP
jgi:pimeloyl-ACP methyl ester carboxylesterase